MPKISQAGSNIWAIVLAGGSGRRLASLTTRLYGHPLPKQFAVISGSGSLLQQTIERFESLIPENRIVVVVPREHDRLARRQLARFPRLYVITQPEDRGTGPGLILPLSWIRHRDPGASIIESPSDHFVPNVRPFLEGTELALEGAESGRLVLLGVKAEWPETGYGWIIPGHEERRGVHLVRGFVEKPDAARAEELWRAGALWNTFVFASTVAGLWKLAQDHLPVQSVALERHFATAGVTGRATDLARLYSTMEMGDFSKHVLQLADNLGVVEVLRSGWSDWGTPERVFASLAGTPQLEALELRLAQREADALRYCEH